MASLRTGLNRRLEQSIKQDKRNFLYYLPVELREELYCYQYTDKNFTYETLTVSGIGSVFIHIYDNTKTDNNAGILFNKFNLPHLDIDDLLENFYNTGTLHMNFSGSFLDMNEHSIITSDYVGPHIHYPITLEWINVLYKINNFLKESI